MQDKLKCEIYLQRRKHVPYINLRLPDVLGPYDNTNRYWCLLEWIKQSNKHPVEVNLKDQTSKLSFVYSKDIAVLIYNLITNRNTVDKYRSYNIACK
jgi:nucleoside-diphosphate-sugar epimerase